MVKKQKWYQKNSAQEVIASLFVGVLVTVALVASAYYIYRFWG